MLQFLRRYFVGKNVINGKLRNDFQYCGKQCYSSRLRLKEEDAEEVRIPMPWGHIAGKWWGRKDEIPILAIHGWQDNAGSFDRLVPHLNVTSFLAIDLPGHGFSSHMPPGKVYTFLEYIYSIRRVIDYYKWEKYSLLGHSLGSALAFAHAAIFKDEVECFISLECARYLLLAYTQEFPKQIAKGVNKILEYDEIMNVDSAPGYTFSEAINVFVAGSLGSVTSVESASTLLKRGATKHKASEVSSTKKNKKTDLEIFLQHELSKGGGSSNSEVKEKVENYEKLLEKMEKASEVADSHDYLYKFTKDPRVKIIQFGIFNMEILKEMSYNIICPVLSVHADEGFLRFGSQGSYKRGNEMVKKNSKYFKHYVVKGNHHVHLNSPENVAPVINSFLRKIKVVLEEVKRALKTGFLISGKYWGPKDKTTFLVVHGWQDNAGSFDTLIPYLTDEYSYLAIDLPGHGFSSWYTSGVAYSVYDHIANFRRIQKHFSWPKMHLLGHSLGSLTEFIYASAFPDDVVTYIGLDFLKPYSIDVKESLSKAKDKIRKLLYYETLMREEAKWYTEDEFIRKLKVALKTERDDMCRILMKRGTIEKNGKFTPSRDPRLKGTQPFGLTQSQNVELAERVKCNVLVIKSNESGYGEPEENFYRVFDIVKENAKRAELHFTDGNHHVHFEKPEVVAPIINKFLSDLKPTV